MSCIQVSSVPERATESRRGQDSECCFFSWKRETNVSTDNDIDGWVIAWAGCVHSDLE